MTKVTLTGFIIVPQDELNAVKRALPDHIKLTLQEPGCISFSVTVSPDNPCRYDVYEEFIDQSAFSAHQQRVKSSYWGQVTANVERHYTISEQ
ncbi:putative quinol monooxygenase [Vibrio hippocampi]|uniref:ABM domain-containing protein n=1 Tax=Vibrio hippocampi TaxID=654686 RepID=A0ABM8ZFW7_9VIBR|nr:putative quinol monooxygenase [Vibrio hippocampi]CAH0525067.1 hypothetical protein VHP8226_00733 [Vibrio hippocampi]